jgi:hypothetical protein
MKKAILIMLAVALSLAPTWGAAAAAAEEKKPHTYTVVLAGGPEANEIHIWLTPDGRTYVIDTIVPLEVGGTVCENPPEVKTELFCQAVLVSDFLVNAEAGDDQIRVSPSVSIPVTLRGGTGDDILVGGSGPDSLSGGSGRDKLVGRAGSDAIFGGPGEDRLFGGPGDDVLRGGPGSDQLAGGPGDNVIHNN